MPANSKQRRGWHSGTVGWAHARLSAPTSTIADAVRDAHLGLPHLPNLLRSSNSHLKSSLKKLLINTFKNYSCLSIAVTDTTHFSWQKETQQHLLPGSSYLKPLRFLSPSSLLAFIFDFSPDEKSNRRDPILRLVHPFYFSFFRFNRFCMMLSIRVGLFRFLTFLLGLPYVLVAESTWV